MKDIVSVRFRGNGKSYYFDPGVFDLKADDAVIVETARGMEYGIVSIGRHPMPEDKIVQPLKPVIRRANRADNERLALIERKEKDSYTICEQKIAAHGLEMKLVGVEYAFDGSKVLFYFTADGRIDFRELVKDLASVLHTRIELRQIGVRDESKMLGGLGVCGRQFCCSQFLFDFQPVSIKMAKEQGMSLNPTKISGTCGRLMCCLKYEQDVYDDLAEITPSVGSSVRTPDGPGIVSDVNLLAGTVFVRLSNSPDSPPRAYQREQLNNHREGKGKKNFDRN